jgi:hypothetical protein
VERSPEYRLSEVGRSVVEMAERRRGCKRCLVQETLGICARFHDCLCLAPSTTTDNHLPQQQTNKETTRAFLPSFVFTHFLLFLRPARRSSSPRERERVPRNDRRIGGDGKQASPWSQKTFDKPSLSVCSIPPRRRRAITSADEILLSCYYCSIRIAFLCPVSSLARGGKQASKQALFRLCRNS